MSVEAIERDIARIVRAAKTVAVVGAHPNPMKAAHYVPAYLVAQGVDVRPVNPVYAGQTLFARPVTSTLAELAVAIDIVDVFRRSEDVPQHLDDILAMRPLPRVVWLQLGITNEAVAHTLRGHGIEVVQDRCLLVDHRAYAAR